MYKKIAIIFIVAFYVLNASTNAMGERHAQRRHYKKIVKISRKACINYHGFRCDKQWNEGHRQREQSKECYLTNRERLKIHTGQSERTIDHVIDEHISIYLKEQPRKVRKFVKKYKIDKSVADHLIGGGKK